MGKLTKMITYNVHDRGRKETGQARCFDTAALARLVNGKAMQESVKLGDVQGYFGHWPRVKFGMQTQEGGVLDGKAVSLPLAVRCTHLSCDNEGNITHQHEFLDTHEGRLASSLYDSNTGGFSSAIDAVPRTNPSIPTAFYGFDFVLAPNYSGNRGHRAVLDGVSSQESEEREDMMALLDAVAEESSIALSMFDALQAQHALALETLDRVSRDNDLLIGRLASGKAALLDDVVGEGGRVAPRLGGLVPDFAKYKTMELPRLVDVKEAGKGEDRSTEARVLRRYGM
jgi:hypothetical protein